MRRPAKSPGGLRNTEPQLGIPSGCAALRRASSALIASIELDSVVLEAERRAEEPFARPGRARCDSRSRIPRAARSRISPLRSIVVTLSTCVHVSPPNAPAFIASAPPTVPGMPAKNAAGPSCQRTQRFASSMQASPALARTRVSSSRSSSRGKLLGRDHGAANAAVAHEQVRPEPEPMHRRRRRQLGENPLELRRASSACRTDPPDRRRATTCACAAARCAGLRSMWSRSARRSLLHPDGRAQPPARAAASARRRRCCPRRASARRRRP